MASRAGFFERMIRDRALARWRRYDRQVQTMPGSQLRRLYREAQDLRSVLDGLMAHARPRVLGKTAPVSMADRPLGADVVWRPPLWSAPVSPSSVVAGEAATHLGEVTTLHHDCPLRETMLRQVPDLSGAAPAPFGVAIEVLGFSGSFLSLAINLPDEIIAGLTRDHILRLDLAVEQERDARIFARLNIRHGPNVDDLLREIPQGQAGRMGLHQVEFDLHQSEINEKRLEGGWLDLIIERPQMNAVLLGDVVLTRYPRADM